MAEAKRCMSCMRPVPEGAASCPNCGYNGSGQNAQGFLPIGARLAKGRFLVGRAEQVRPNSTDYAAYDLKNLQVCTLREYLPAGGCIRAEGESLLQPTAAAQQRYKDGLAEFLQFYGRLADMPEDSALLHVTDCFSQNGTAYAVLEQFEGITLKQLLQKNGGTLTAQQTGIVMAPVLDALQWLHERGMLHHSVTPDDILINRNGDVRLAGLMLSARGQKPATGYASPELAAGEPPQPQSDVYSVAAVYYRCLVGTLPQDALQRRSVDTLAAPAELDAEIPAEVSSAVWHAMLVNPDVRTQDIATFRRQLEGELPVYLQEEVRPTPEAIAAVIRAELEPEEKKQRWKLWSLIAACFLAVMAAVYLLSLFVGRQQQAHREQQLQQQLGEQAGQENLLEAPDYVGQHLEFLEFDTLSFDYVIVSTHREGAQRGEVVAQEPQAGTGLSQDDRCITLFVHNETTVVIPDLTDFYSLNARALMEQLGVNCVFVYEDTTEHQAGLVIGQSAAPGSEFSPEEDLVLTIAQRPEE